MRYPSSVQPFAISDIKALESLGHRVDVYALSRRDPRHRTLLTDYSIRLRCRSHVSWRTATALAKPRNWVIVGALVNFLWRHRDGRIGPFLKALVLTPRLVEVTALLRREPVDVVHAFWGHYPALVLSLVAKFAPHCCRSVFLGAYDLTSHRIPYSLPAIADCQVLYTHSEENRSILRSLGADEQRISVIPRGIPLDLAKGPLPERQRYRICTAANLQREKNVDTILKVFKRVREIMPETHLIVAGDGAERVALQKLAVELGINKNVTFTGHISRHDLFHEMAKAEVFIFLSTKISERLPNVVKEAMLAGCYCIVSETVGIRELITDGKTGEIVSDLSVDRVAARIISALKANRIEIGAAASRFIRERLSADAAMKRYVVEWRKAFERASLRSV